MKFGKLIEYSKRNTFQNHAENEAGMCVPLRGNSVCILFTSS